MTIYNYKKETSSNSISISDINIDENSKSSKKPRGRKLPSTFSNK